MLAMDVWCFSKSTARIDLEKHQTRLHYWGISLCNFGESPLQFWVFLLYTKHWSWLDQQKPVRNTRMDKAVNYVRNRRDTAETYLEDGRCSFTNNLSENAIRPFAVGRKMNILALQYRDSGKLSTDVPDVDTGIDWLVYLAQYSQQCQAQSYFVVRSRLDTGENTEIMAGSNQAFYCGTLRPDCRPFRTGIFRRTGFSVILLTERMPAR